MITDAEKICYMEYDTVHRSLVCSNCATPFYDTTVMIQRSYWDENDVGYVDFKYCPMCGYRIIRKHVG